MKKKTRNNIKLAISLLDKTGHEGVIRDLLKSVLKQIKKNKVMSQTILYIFIIILVPVYIGSCLSGCKSSRHINKSETITDSTAEKEVTRLNLLLQWMEQEHQKEVQELATTGIYFDNFPCDSADKDPSSVTVEKDGTIKAIGKNLKSATFSNQKLSKERDYLKKRSDSLAAALHAEKANVKVETKTVSKNTSTRVYVWWPVIVAFITGMVLESRFKILYHLKTFLYQLKFKS